MKIIKPKYQIFVSSTYTDLREERQSVMWEILHLRHIPVGMENFGATDDRGWEIIRRTIDTSDYYILIVAGRYGYISEGESQSWTHKEYEYAKSKKIPVLAFIREQTHITSDKMESKEENKEKLKKFTDQIDKNHNRKSWTTKDELVQKVTLSITQHINDDEGTENQRPGWYRGDQLPSSTSVEEFARLSKENEELKKKLKNEIPEEPISILSKNEDELLDMVETRVPYVYKKKKTDEYFSTVYHARYDGLEKFVENKNKTVWVEFKIKNLGNRPINSFIIDICLDKIKIEDVDYYPDEFNEALVPVVNYPKWATDPNEHCYVHDKSIKGDNIIIRQKMKLLPPGVCESVVSLRLTMKLESMPPKIESTVKVSVTTENGTKVEKDMIIKIDFRREPRDLTLGEAKSIKL